MSRAKRIGLSVRVLDDQKAFFEALVGHVGEAGAAWDPFPSQVEKVYQEQSGRRLTSFVEPPPDARRAHARAHDLALA